MGPIKNYSALIQVACHRMEWTLPCFEKKTFALR